MLFFLAEPLNVSREVGMIVYTYATYLSIIFSEKQGLFFAISFNAK